MESIVEEAELIAGSLLPEKSKEKYIQVFDTFQKWKEDRQIDENNFSEAVLLVYFDQLSKKYNPSSLWCWYSMLKTYIETNKNIDIGYAKLNTFLKKMSVGFQAKKANTFQGEEIEKFLADAPDSDYLATKVILIFGIYGATRADELTKVDLKDVTEQGQVFVVKIPHTKTNMVRVFTIENEYAELVRKYRHLRSSIVSTSRFSVNFQKGKCCNQAIGKNKFLSTPKLIAKFLNLPQPELYTGHSFRRTSATLLADGGGDILTLKRHGGWRSSSAAEGYVQDSITNKRKIGSVIVGQIKVKKTESTTTSTISSATSSAADPVDEQDTFEHDVVDIQDTLEPSTLSQSVVTIIHSQQVQNPPVQPQLSNELQRMEFNNCKVEIHFHSK